MVSSSLNVVCALSFALNSLELYHGVSAAALHLQVRDGSTPGLAFDPATSSYCSWWIDYNGSDSCQDILDNNWIDLDAFYRWNPSIGTDCSGLKSGKSYCVEAFKEPAPSPKTTTLTLAPTISKTPLATPTPSPSPSPSKASTTAVSSSSMPANGVATPSPVQKGIVSNCNKFHFVVTDENCSTMADQYGTSVSDIVAWNGLNSGCTDLWGKTYACVSVIGGSSTTPSSTKVAPTTTTPPGNGVSTPTPAQPRMVTNCNKFYFVLKDEGCDAVSQKTGAQVSDIIAWNNLNSGCTDLWGSTNACVGIIGQTTTAKSTTSTKPTTTQQPAGPATPTPTQPGMVAGCTLWHYISDDTTCQQVLDYEHITLAQFFKWNTGVKADCTNMWKGTYACVRGP